MRSYTSLIQHEGNKELFRFIKLGVIGLISGMPIHMHVEGLRGTGKTTILRSARSILPSIIRVKDCRFNCDPCQPNCPEHKDSGTEEAERVETPYLEISHSAKIGTVVGTLDLNQLTDTQLPVATLLPGILPSANRGIVLIDEINRLADTAPELTDILLDVMGTKPGRIQIEENGLPTVSLDLQVSIWAASNPDEDPGPVADIRRQLSDRFDFTIQMGRPTDKASLLSILDCGRQEIPGRGGRCKITDKALSQSLVEKAGHVKNIEIPFAIHDFLAEVYLKHSLESLRALEAIKTGATLAAALRGGQRVNWTDVFMVTPAALRHRVSPEQLEAILSDLKNERDLLQNTNLIAGCSPKTPFPQANNLSEALSGTFEQKSSRNSIRRWLNRLTIWLRRLFAPPYTSPPESRVMENTNNYHRDIRVHAKEFSTAKTSDPMDTPLSAPPAPAQKLLDVPISEAITTGELLNDPNQ